MHTISKLHCKFLCKFLWVLLLVSTAVSGCSPKQESQYSFENSSPEVHYEPVNNEGEFLDHQVVEDPMRDTYEQGAWGRSNDSTVQTMGTESSNNRINIVFVGDGYTSAQIGQYRTDVESNIERLSGVEPFKNYLAYFKFHRVDVVSKESGVSQEVKGVKKKTALEMSYYCSGLQRLLCVNANKAMEQAQNAPKVDSVFALANSSVYGGAGYRSPAISTLAARNPSALELALHEFAHSFAKLADEYDYEGTGSGCLEAANVTANTRTELESKKTKWYRWLNLSNVGAFKGSCHSLKYYRPTENSKMRTLGKPFEPVNTEQMVIAIYKKVKPIEWATAEGTIRGHRTLELRAMRPSTHKLLIVWKVDSKEVLSHNGNERLDTSTLNLKRGQSYKITATVIDQTSAVRDEEARARYMTQTLAWKLKL